MRSDLSRGFVLRLLRTPVARALTEPLVAPRVLDDYLALFDPTWSLDEIRARVVGVAHETRDVTSLLLEPNENWRPHLAGQHVLCTVEIDGARQTRSFSLSRVADDGRLVRITIKAHSKGCVSLWARDRAKVGDVVTLSPAQGDFVLPNPVPDKLLFVSGGSGITPLVAMGQQLAKSQYEGDLCWIHCERGDVPLENDLHCLRDTIGRAALHVHRSTAARLNLEQLCAWAPDWTEREAFVCGPRGLMELVESSYAARGLSHRVHSEDYQPRFHVVHPESATPGDPGQLVFARAQREIRAEPDISLLEQAERAGLRPAHGCRRGICHTCKCKKLEGTVRNMLTGETSDETDQEIQLCIHSPLGHVSIDL